jgi:aspartate/tyrosine/aromatic aminotransferase
LLAGKIDKEYLPVQGLEAFLQHTSKVILGEGSKALQEKRVAVVQTLSGTNALRIAAEFLSVSPVSVVVFLRGYYSYIYPIYLHFS